MGLGSRLQGPYNASQLPMGQGTLGAATCMYPCVRDVYATCMYPCVRDTYAFLPMCAVASCRLLHRVHMLACRSQTTA